MTSLTLQDFRLLIEQMRRSSVPKRLLFVWSSTATAVENEVDGIEVHRHDMAMAISTGKSEPENPKQVLEANLKKVCESYEDNRNEPSALIIENAILLPRYGCDLTLFLRHAISPRSAVIMIFPPESQRHLPAKAEIWIKKNTQSIVHHVAKQLGEPECIIEV